MQTWSVSPCVVRQCGLEDDETSEYDEVALCNPNTKVELLEEPTCKSPSSNFYRVPQVFYRPDRSGATGQIQENGSEACTSENIRNRSNIVEACPLV